LGIPNIYSDTNWDLGPTWCYLVVGQKITLIDTGRFGNYDFFKSLFQSIDMDISDIDRIVITHSHEDHDGNLPEILSLAKAELWAHQIYQEMISYHPAVDHDGVEHPELPGSCRLCTMPQEYIDRCIPYHQKRSLLKIDRPIEDNSALIEDDLVFVHTPGHTPDSICIVLEGEAIFTGDTLLPDITPHPSLADAFKFNCRILPENYRSKNKVYGLMNYIDSLNRIASLTYQPIQTTLPAHRLFYNNRFNLIHKSSDRAKEIIRFHRDRCSSLLEIIGNRPTGIEEVTTKHFPPALLKGMGKIMGQREILAHIEILENYGDVCRAFGNKDLIQSTGSNMFLSIFESYLA
jgi:glyoxylase-like metal-dependent hydrolase (beta-lactamase superfamily II)